jgi:hypothetical protein
MEEIKNFAKCVKNLTFREWHDRSRGCEIVANLIAPAAALRVKKKEITEVKQRELQTLAGRARHGSWHYPSPSF